MLVESHVISTLLALKNAEAAPNHSPQSNIQLTPDESFSPSQQSAGKLSHLLKVFGGIDTRSESTDGSIRFILLPDSMFVRSLNTEVHRTITKDPCPYPRQYPRVPTCRDSLCLE